jgi:glycerol-3-phosphate dehydrogenase
MKLRATNLDRLDGGRFDVFVVGGGINGAVSAAVLSGRGARVALVDRGDFAHFTSQESSNLVWGGFKYLENYELALVRKLCMSRNRLIEAYPSNITEISFLAALDKSAPFPSWLAGVGSLGYWGIGNFFTHRPRFLTRRAIGKLEPVVNIENVHAGIEYYDAYLEDNDARFVFSFVRSAIDSGATVANYVEMTAAEKRDGLWHITCTDVESGRTFQCTAKFVVNAAGPFVDGINQAWNNRTEHRIVYSKGIHLVVPQVTPNGRVLAFFDETQRLFYVIPMGKRSVIGTTDSRVDSMHTQVTQEDREFLLRQINQRLNLDRPLQLDDIISERCGVRPLVITADGDDKTSIDWTTLSRRHEIEVHNDLGIVSIFGGKLTDCLNVGEEVADALVNLGQHLEDDDGKWFGEAPLESSRAFYRQARLIGLDQLRANQTLEPLSKRLWRRYGRRAFAMLEAIQEDPSMAEEIMGAADYLRVELHLAARSEMVTRLEDFMRRRSKISLVIPDAEIRNSSGLREVAEILFGDQADYKLAEYFSNSKPIGV